MFSVRADVGGFGIGDSQEFTWQAQALAGIRLYRHSAFLFGYRWLEFDTIVDGNGQKLLQSGPIIGLKWNIL